MRRLILASAVALAVSACGADEPAATTAPGSVTEPTPPATTTGVEPPATTVPSSAAYTTADCRTPPVTFALLCDVYELLARHHVDAPLDPSALAAGASLGIQGFEGEPGEPVDFVCAIPDPEFERLCGQLADTVGGDPRQTEEAIEDAVASMIAFSLDPFTYYLPPELSGALTSDGIVSAVGLLLTIRDPVGSVCTIVDGNCRLEVVLAVLDGPAFDAGVEGGDVVTAVDGAPVAGMTLVEVAGALDGPEGSTVTVEITPEGGNPVGHVLERQAPPTPDLHAEIPRDGVGYIRLPDFEADIPDFLHSVLEEWTDDGLGRIVLDLRDNPGGFVDVATLVASEFLSDGLVLRSEGPGENLDYPVQEGGLATGRPPLTVVVNAGSASASEILAGVLQERGRAVVVGRPTFGKDTVQIGFRLRNDGELRVTVARWVTPGGVSVAPQGVVPEVLVDIPADASPAEVVDLALGQT